MYLWRTWDAWQERIQRSSASSIFLIFCVFSYLLSFESDSWLHPYPLGVNRNAVPVPVCVSRVPIGRRSGERGVSQCALDVRP